MTAALQPAWLALAARLCMNKTARPAAWRKRLAQPALLVAAGGFGVHASRPQMLACSASLAAADRRLQAIGSQAIG
ncbi:hypothetical protein BLN97_41420 [Bradyrhizobium elkanii]|nr:hypothetical protein BLN97_41420 [Bradyrhizobium elkanii]